MKAKPTSPHSAFLWCLKVKRNRISLTSNSTCFRSLAPRTPATCFLSPAPRSLPGEQKGSKAAATPSPKAFGSQQLSPHKSSLIIQQRANFNLFSPVLRVRTVRQAHSHGSGRSSDDDLRFLGVRPPFPEEAARQLRVKAQH